MCSEKGVTACFPEGKKNRGETIRETFRTGGKKRNLIGGQKENGIATEKKEMRNVRAAFTLGKMKTEHVAIPVTCWGKEGNDNP